MDWSVIMRMAFRKLSDRFGMRILWCTWYFAYTKIIPAQPKMLPQMPSTYTCMHLHAYPACVADRLVIVPADGPVEATFPVSGDLPVRGLISNYHRQYIVPVSDITSAFPLEPWIGDQLNKNVMVLEVQNAEFDSLVQVGS